MSCSTNKIYISLIKTILLCLLALLFNLASAYFFGDMLHVPLFLDTIGTVVTVFYAGLVPSLFVAGFYNVFRVLLMVAMGNPAYPWDMMYALCGLAIVFCTWVFIYKNSNFRGGTILTVLYLLLIVLVPEYDADTGIGVSLSGIENLKDVFSPALDSKLLKIIEIKDKSVYNNT